MVQNSIEVGKVKGPRGSSLGRPRLAADIVNVDVAGVGGIRVQDVDGIEKLMTWFLQYLSTWLN